MTEDEIMNGPIEAVEEMLTAAGLDVAKIRRAAQRLRDEVDAAHAEGRPVDVRGCWEEPEEPAANGAGPGPETDVPF